MTDLTSDAAKRLSNLGAEKGGKARANVLTPEQRSEIARKAVTARWAKAGKPPAPEQYSPIQIVPVVAEETIPFSLFQGRLRIGELELECHVLNDYRRVFTQREIVRILTGGRESGNLQRYLDSNP